MIVKTIAHGRHVLARIMEFPDLSVDTETKAALKYAKDKKAALIIGRARIKIWSICHRGESYSFPTNLMDPEFPTMREWVELFRPYFIARSKRKVFHNFNYDGNVFAYYDAFFHNVWDTVIGCQYSNPNFDKDLKSRANLYGRYIQQTAVVNFDDLDALADYAEDDVISTDEFFQMQMFGVVRRPRVLYHVNEEGILIKHRNPMPDLWCKPDHEALSTFHRRIIRYMELPMLRATIRAEQRGIPVLRAKLGEIRNKIRKDNFKLLTDIFYTARGQFKLGSNDQVAATLKRLGVDLPGRTKSGKVSVGYESLFLAQDQHPIVKKIVKHKQNAKLLSVYVGKKGLEHYCDEHDRIHPSLNTVGARTGRTSCSNPNLQQLPAAKDTYGIRDCFNAPKGQKIICLDFSQIEIRVMAILSKDEEMSRILRDPKGDIHQNTADQFQVPRSPTAKQLNFLQLYAGGAYAMSRKLTLEGAPTTPEQADAYITRYNEVYPSVREYRKGLLRDHQRHGFVRYLIGRKRFLLDVDWSKRSEMHKAETTLSNNICQGSAQDLLKSAIVRTDTDAFNPDSFMLSRFQFSRQHTLRLKDYSRKLEKFRREMRLAHLKWALQVHDENLYFCDSSAAEEMGHRCAEVMTWCPYFEPITSLSVPILVDGGVGDTWKIAKSKTPEHKIEFAGEYWED